MIFQALTLLSIIYQSLCSVVVVYDQHTNITQQAANTLTFNITATFPTSSDIQIVVQLPGQIASQENIVCGVTGLTNGACNLVYSKFIVTFKSATPTFQIIFINVNNPITTYTDPVQLNASVISTQTSIFATTLQLQFQSKIIPFTITQPTTTYNTAPLIISIDGTTSLFPTSSLITITAAGIVESLATITGVIYGSFELKNGQIIIRNAQLQSNSMNSINITQYTIQSTQPIAYSIDIQDTITQGFVTQYKNQLIVQNINNNYQFTLQSSSLVIGMPTSMTIILCNLAQASAIAFTSTLNLQYQTNYASGCHNSIFSPFNNPLSTNQIPISLKVSVNNYDSISQTIPYSPIKDNIQMSMTQNTTVMLNYALVLLTLQFNQQFSNFMVQLSNQYQMNSCTIQDINCTMLNNIYQSDVFPTPLNRVTIKIEILLPGCDSFSFSAKVLYSGVEIATSNSLTPSLTKYKLSSSLDTSSFDLGQDSLFTISNLDSSIITSYDITTDLSNLQCQDCIQTGNQLQYGQVSSLQFSAQNNNNVKPYTITIIAYKDKCLIAQQQFKQQAQAQPLSLSVSTDNNYQYAQGLWKVIIAPDMQDKGILSIPIQITDTIENRINSSAVYVNATSITYNLTNLYNIQDSNFWEVQYFRDGYQYAYGNLTLKKLDIMGFSNIQITKQNTILAETDNITVTFDTYFDVPINGVISIITSNLTLANITLNDQQLNNQQILPKGKQIFQFKIQFANISQNTISDIFNVTSLDNSGRVLQQSNINYSFNYKCKIDSCNICTVSECIKCNTNFTLSNNTCSLVCKENQKIVNNICIDNINTSNNQTDSNVTTSNNTLAQQSINKSEGFIFTPPIISPIVALIFLFSISRKCWNRESETFIIFYSMASVLEHIIHAFLFIYFFATMKLLYGLCMISVVVIHFSSQIYIVLMNLFKIDPEYIGIRQQYHGFKILHILSLTFCGRLLLLLISKFDQSYVWSTPWTYKISVLQRLQNYLIFLFFEQLGAGTLAVLAMLDNLYLFYIEILSFQIIQIAVTLYTFNYLSNQKNIEMRLQYI